MIIDGHAHAYGPFADPEKLIPLLNRLKVDKIVLCPGASNNTDPPNIPIKKPNWFITRPRLIFFSNFFLRHVHGKKALKDRSIGNDIVYSLRQKFPDRILQFYWVNFQDSNYLTDLQEAYNKMTFHGIKLHQCVIPFKNDSEEMRRTTEFAGEKNLPIFIHLYNPKEARKLFQLARSCPKTNFIIAHCMGLENAIRKAKDLTNLYFDISTFYIISKKRIKKAMAIFGADHVLMGSDSPLGYNNLENQLKKIQGMNLSKGDKKKIMGENIADLLKLKN
jgi:predicted TIM-barrel fold metal-dependent hydrolase